jgi:hypothetical protein
MAEENARRLLFADREEFQAALDEREQRPPGRAVRRPRKPDATCHRLAPYLAAAAMDLLACDRHGSHADKRASSESPTRPG